MSNAGHNGNNQRASVINFDEIQFFDRGEFQGQLYNLDSGIIQALDRLRLRVGRILISPAAGSITRYKAGSMHDISAGRLSLAIDIMPLDVSLTEFYEAAKEIAQIGGVGLYPDWLPHAGAHIDLRARKPNGDLFTWGGLKTASGQKYVSIGEVLNA